MKRLLKSRRGAAIEGALLFMMVVFALSMLLLASVTAMGYRNLADERAYSTRREIEQIGVYFATEDARLPDYAAERGYTAENGRLNINGNTLILTNKHGKTILHIERVLEDNVWSTKHWYYGDPPQEQ